MSAAHTHRVQMSMDQTYHASLGHHYRLHAYRVRRDDLSLDIHDELVVRVPQGHTSDDLEAEMRGPALELARRVWPQTPGLLFESGDDNLLIWEVLQ